MIENLEEKLKQAAKHFTSKDQLLPFIPINPDIEPDDVPFSDDENPELNPLIDPNIDYEKILDENFGEFPK